MNHPGYTEHKDNVLKRLNRAEGQVRGISRMVAADTYCIDVLTQISAAQAALDKVALELLRDHAKHCLTPPDADASTDAAQAEHPGDILEAPTVSHQKADELVDAISRLIAR